MTDCERALELISQQLDGPLAAEDAAWLAAHLDACPDCRALQADLAALHQQLPLLAAQPPAELKGSVMDAVRACKVTPFQGKKRQWHWRSLASLAAVLALVFVGGYGMRQWDAGQTAAPAAGGDAPSVQAFSGGETQEQTEGAGAPDGSGELTRDITIYGQDPASPGAAPEINSALAPTEEDVQATLVLDALPEGWQEVLPGVADPDGAVVPCKQAQALADLVEQQGLAAAVEGDLYGEGNCQILLADG